MPYESTDATQNGFNAESLYSGPEAQNVFERSYLKWRLLLDRAKSLSSIPESLLNLHQCLGRMPALPDKIDPVASALEGYSTWLNSDQYCAAQHGIKSRTERSRSISLTKRHTTMVTLQNDGDNFRCWQNSSCNALAPLFAGWAYVLSASLAERKSLPMRYHETIPSFSPSTTLDLSYASPEERRWWRAVLSCGVGWSVDNELLSPWAITVVDLDIAVKDSTEDTYLPPTAHKAAEYISRLCSAYDARSQSSAALAAVVMIPLRAQHRYSGPDSIELPRPLFPQTKGGLPSASSLPAEFGSISYLMMLSLSTHALGPALWSVFWDPDVQCHCAGAWLMPISMVLRPLIKSQATESLAKVLSFSNVSALWIGLAICGTSGPINLVYKYLTELHPYECTIPDVDGAVWTATTASFMDRHHQSRSHHSTISREDVWRLRHQFSGLYEKYNGFDYTPWHGWAPFGYMEISDVELELQDHLHCDHDWTYSHWTWKSENTPGPDAGFSLDAAHIQQQELPQRELAPLRAPIPLPALKMSQTATKAVFSWAGSQVERGFGSHIVEFFFFGAKDPTYIESTKKVDYHAIDEWRKQVKDSQKKRLQ